VLSISTVIDHDKLVLQYTRDVKSVLNVHDLATGTFLYEIKIPVGTVAGIIGHTKDSDLFIQFLSYLTPGTIYRYNFRVEDESERLTIFKQATVQSFDSSMFETKQVFYESKDGTRIPMFITHKKVNEPNSLHSSFWLYISLVSYCSFESCRVFNWMARTPLC